MTGIERLHKLSEDLLPCRLWNILVAGTEEDWDCHEGDYGTVSDVLRAIADQIERESDVETVRSDAMEAWRWVRRRGGLATLELHEETFADLMRQRDEYRDLARGYERDATWVREHGGLDHVRAEWRSRSNLKRMYEKEKAKVERQQRHIEFVQGKCRERLKRIAALNKTVAEMRPRLMPKVLDADGVEVEVGDDLYTVEGMLKFHVSAIDKKSGRIATEAMFALDKWADPKMYTHRAPVLAADGRPLRVGETVWLTDGSERHVVLSTEEDGIGSIVTEVQAPGAVKVHISPSRLTHQRPVLDADGVPIKVGDTVWPKYPYEEPDRQVESAEVVYVHRLGRVDVQAKYATGMSFRQQVDAEQLTHAKPEPIDTWQRIEEDATLSPEVYCHRNGIDISQKDGTEIFLADTVEPMARDLVRRCRALAERERGE